MKTIVTIVGARPQFIKASAVSRAIRQCADLKEIIVHTGQHYDEQMSRVFFDELQIPEPAFHLGIGSGSHGDQTGRMLAAVERVLLETRPDITLVYGDTNSTLAGALASAKLAIPVAHVEAGLRSFNRAMPEEINRVVTDHVSSWLFAPTDVAVGHLRREGIAEGAIHLVGDVMYDVAVAVLAGGEKSGFRIAALDLKTDEYLLATIHRAENTDAPRRLGAIAAMLLEISRSWCVVLPLHPRTRGALQRLGIDLTENANVRVIEPVGYREMLELERGARLIVTDSGGVQKEAYFQGVPCVTLRDETEWVETVDSGWNRLASPEDPAAMLSAVSTALRLDRTQLARGELYGGGRAAENIVRILSR